MKNKGFIITFVFISILLSFLNFYITNSILYSCLLFILFILTMILIIKEKEKGEFIKERSIECIKFINNFVITLSIKKNNLLTFETIKSSFSSNLNKELKMIEHLDIDDKIEYLSRYFKCDIYKVFLKIFTQYNYSGGDIISITRILIHDSRLIETSLDEYQSVAKNKLVEFISMRLIAFLILVVLKFALSDFFLKIQNQMFFAPGVFMFFVIFLISLFLFFKKYFNYSFIKGGFYGEKNKKSSKFTKFKFSKRNKKNSNN